jgi:hypothetical protein
MYIHFSGAIWRDISLCVAPEKVVGREKLDIDEEDVEKMIQIRVAHNSYSDLVEEEIAQ